MRRAIALLLLAILAASCSDLETVTSPDFGYLDVTVLMTGLDLDSDGFELRADGGSARVLRTPPYAATWYLAPGEHTIALERVAPNCTVKGPETRSVLIDRGSVVKVGFEVACVGTGVTVTTRTTGPNFPVQYRVFIDAMDALVGANGELKVGRLTPGTHTVTLFTPAYCAAAGGSQRTVLVAPLSFSSVTFDVACGPVERMPGRIAYAATYTNIPGSWLETVRSDGTDLQRLGRSGSEPEWAGDGIRILTSDTQCGNDYYFGFSCAGGVTLVDPELGTESRVTPASSGFSPSWSPVRDEIVFDIVLGSFGDHALKLLDVATSRVTPFNLVGPQSAKQASWSPDGQRLAFVCAWTSSTADICIVNRDGTQLERLTNDAMVDASPTWVGDGSRIAYARSAVGGSWIGEIVLFDLATREGMLLGPGADPSWSPDGILFAGADGVFAMDEDGSNRRRITTGLHRAPSFRRNFIGGAARTPLGSTAARALRASAPSDAP